MLVEIEQFRADEIRREPGTSILLGDQSVAEAFLVLDGEVTLRLEGGERTLARDTWAFVPAGAACSLFVAGNEPARLLHVQVPGSEAGSEIVVRRVGGMDGEKITDRPERRATVLVDTEEITISEFDYGPGERGAPLHVHHEHADGFLVVEGEFTIHFRDGSRPLPAGTLLVIPPGVVHGFDNDSTAHARCFNFHMPSSGFADYMRGRNPDFDQLDPPQDGGADPELALAARLSA